MRIDKEVFEITLANTGMSLNEACQKAGVSAVGVIKILSENREARPKTVGKIARALGIQVEELIVRK